MGPIDNNSNPDKSRKKYTWNEGEDEGDTEPVDDSSEHLFGPPPPRAPIFHRDDSPPPGPGSSDGASDTWQEEAPSDGNYSRDADNYYSTPNPQSGKDMPWRSWLYKPIVAVAIVATLITLSYMTPHHSLWRWLIYIVAAIYIPYAILNRRGGRRYYNMHDDPYYGHRGCFYPRTRNIWRWWWH